MQKLLFLLPFYVIRYEKSREDIEKDPEKLQKLLDEYVTISRRLEESLLENGKEALHRYLVEVIIKIADYIFSDSEKTKKGVDRAMGGEVLELKTDKLINEIRQDVKEEVKEEAPAVTANPTASVQKVGGVLKIHIGEGKDIDIEMPMGFNNGVAVAEVPAYLPLPAGLPAGLLQVLHVTWFQAQHRQKSWNRKS